MTQRQIVWFFMAVALVFGLSVAPVAADAQAPPHLTELYAWANTGLTVRYPSGWVVVETAGTVSLHPSGRDVSDGQGPELILFVETDAQPARLDALIQNYVAGITGTTSAVVAGTLEGYASQSFTFDQVTPDTLGAVQLIAGPGGQVLGMAFTVRDSDAAEFLPVLEAMFASATFNPVALPVAVLEDTLSFEHVLYGYRLQYPADWTLDVQNYPYTVHIAPPGVEVGLDTGPDMVVLSMNAEPSEYGDLRTMTANMLGDRPIEYTVLSEETVAGYEALLVDYVNTSRQPQVRGVVQLIRLDSTTVIGIGYRAPADVYDTYAPVFEAIRLSLQFPSRAGLDRAESTSVASVQLAQRFEWPYTGLALYFPDNWSVEETIEDGDPILYARPRPALTIDEVPFQLIQALTMPYVASVDLKLIADLVVAVYGATLQDSVEATVAGYPALIYDLVDDSEYPPVYLRLVALSVPEAEVSVVFVLGSEQAEWEAYRPLVSAFIGSIQRLEQAADRSSIDWAAVAADGASRGVDHLVAANAPLVGPRPQQGDDPEAYLWTEAGVSISLADGWRTLTAGQDYDLALVSPDVLMSSQGSFVMLRLVPFVGRDTTLSEALDPLAEEIGSLVVPYTTDAGLEGVAIHFEDEEQGTTHHLILLPYGDDGGALYIQSTAIPASDDDQVVAMINSLTIDVPHSDYAAVDAAWQASLAESGRLIYGDADAPVTMVEFLSYTCGHCANFSTSIDRLIALDVETGRVQFELGLLGGDQYSALATHATYCATEQGRGYSAYKALFQGYFERGYDVVFTEEGIRETLEGLDLDLDALAACTAATTYQDEINGIVTRFVDKGLTGTPTVMLGANGDDPEPIMLPTGEVWSGAIPIEILREMMTAALDAGVPFSEFFGQ